MPESFTGTHDGRGLRVAIVVAAFNSFITERLLNGATGALTQMGVPAARQTVAHVPGAFELPVAAKRLAASGQYEAVICLGCVIRGETSHYDYVCQAATQGILQAGLDTGVPVIFGVLTTDTAAQARARAGDGPGNKGAECAVAAVEMASLFRQLDTSLQTYDLPEGLAQAVAAPAPQGAKR